MNRATIERPGPRGTSTPAQTAKRRWLWFFGLWSAGLGATAVVAGLVRWVVGM